MKLIFISIQSIVHLCYVGFFTILFFSFLYRSIRIKIFMKFYRYICKYLKKKFFFVNIHNERDLEYLFNFPFNLWIKVKKKIKVNNIELSQVSSSIKNVCFVYLNNNSRT